MRRPSWPLALALIAVASCHGGAPSGNGAGKAEGAALPTHIYHRVATIRIGGSETRWGRLTDDARAHRLYVTHGSSVAVIDTRTDSVVGTIDSLPGVHGFAVARELGKGFASDGDENRVAIVDLATLRVVSRVDTGRNPDAILYVPDFKEVWAFNRGGNSVTVIDATGGHVVATVPLPGRPESAVYDPPRKKIDVNIGNANEIVVLDPSTRTFVKTWPIAPGMSATGLAIHPDANHLFTVCRNGYMVMIDAIDGLMIANVRIGRDADAARFDPVTRLAFSANGEGTVTIAHVDDPKHLRVLQTLKTAPSARTMALDPLTHRIYLSSADYEPAGKGARAGGRRMVPGSFRVLVYAVEGS